MVAIPDSSIEIPENNLPGDPGAGVVPVFRPMLTPNVEDDVGGPRFMELMLDESPDNESTPGGGNN